MKFFKNQNDLLETVYEQMLVQWKQDLWRISTEEKIFYEDYDREMMRARIDDLCAFITANQK